MFSHAISHTWDSPDDKRPGSYNRTAHPSALIATFLAQKWWSGICWGQSLLSQIFKIEISSSSLMTRTPSANLSTKSNFIVHSSSLFPRTILQVESQGYFTTTPPPLTIHKYNSDHQQATGGWFSPTICIKFPSTLLITIHFS